jgi:AcrR family transcriptional regulator
MTASGADAPGPRRRSASGGAGYRAPGRPRDSRCDAAIITATLQALAASGFTGLSMEAVATRAGVGKATVYRRWPTKEALVADALGTLADTFEPVDTGSLRGDLVAWLNAVRRHNIQTLSGRIMPRLLAEKEAHPELFDTYRRRVLAPSRERVAAVLRRGVDSGELAHDLDIDLVTDMLVGPITYRQYTSGGQEVSGGRIGAVVDTVLEGIRRRSADAAVVDRASVDRAGAADRVPGSRLAGNPGSRASAHVVAGEPARAHRGAPGTGSDGRVAHGERGVGG